MDTATFIVGAHIGGTDAANAIGESVRKLRETLNESCIGSYSPTAKTFWYVLRIDGELDFWGKNAIESVRFSKRQTEISAEIYLARSCWEHVSEMTFRTHLAEGIKNATIAMCDHAQRRGVKLSREALQRDVQAALEILATEDTKACQ